MRWYCLITKAEMYYLQWQYRAQCLRCPPLSPITLSVCLSLLEPENSNSPSVVLWRTECVSQPSAICVYVYSRGLQMLFCCLTSLLQLPLSSIILFFSVGLNMFITLTHTTMSILSVQFLFKLPRVNPKATPHFNSTYVCWFNAWNPALSWCSLLPSRWFCSFLPSKRINSMAFNYWATTHSWKWTGMFRDPSQSIEVSGLKNKCVCVCLHCHQQGLTLFTVRPHQYTGEFLGFLSRRTY